MTLAELDAAYDNTAAVKNSAEILAGFETRGAEIAKRFAATMDLRYGRKVRERYDYFPARKDAPLLIFIHGGYWQMRAKETFRFLAKGPLSQGFHFASIGYTLAPEYTLPEIISEVRGAIVRIRSVARKYGADDSRVILCGWSAGAHLAVSALDLPGVIGALAISGIYDLEPIARGSLNRALRLSAEDIALRSPLRMPFVQKNVIAACGGEELPELQRQTWNFMRARAAQGLPGLSATLPRRNHFTVLEELEKPQGSLTKLLKFFC